MCPWPFKTKTRPQINSTVLNGRWYRTWARNLQCIRSLSFISSSLSYIVGNYRLKVVTVSIFGFTHNFRPLSSNKLLPPVACLITLWLLALRRNPVRLISSFYIRFRFYLHLSALPPTSLRPQSLSSSSMPMDGSALGDLAYLPPKWKDREPTLIVYKTGVVESALY